MLIPTLSVPGFSLLYVDGREAIYFSTNGFSSFSSIFPTKVNVKSEASPNRSFHICTELNQVYSRLLQAMTVNMGYQQPAQPQQQPQQPMYQQPQQPGYQQQYQQPYGYQQQQQAPYTNNPMK